MTQCLLHYLDKALSATLVVSASAMILVVLLQILSRFALPWSFHWTEEMARICFIYMVSFGAGLALKDNEYVGVELLINRLSGRARIYMESIIYISISILMLVMFLSVFPLLSIVKLHFSPALQINMIFLYASMMIMSFFVMLYAFLQFIERLRHR